MGRMGRGAVWNVKRKLIVILTGILIVPTLVVGITAYERSNTEIEGKIIASARENVNVLNQAITDTLSPKVHDADYFAKVIDSELLGDEPLLLQKLVQYIELHPEAMNAFVGTTDGAMVLYPEQELPAGYDPRVRPWYEDAVKANGKAIITAPYFDASTGDSIVTVAKQLEDRSGVYGIDLSLQKLQALTGKIKVGEKGESFLLDESHKFIVHPWEEPGSEAKDDFITGMYANTTGEFAYEQDGQSKVMTYTTNELTGWKVAGSMSQSEIREATRPILYMTLMVIGIAVLIGGLLSFYLMRSITRPLSRMNEFAGAISKGDLTVRLDGLKKDEFGELGNSLNAMSAGLRTLIQGVSMNAMHLAASSEQLTAGADQTSKASETIVSIIQEVAAGTEHQVRMLGSSTTSIHQIASSAADASYSTKSASEAAEQSAVISLEGRTAVQIAMEEMEALNRTFLTLSEAVAGLGERSKEIGGIAQLLSAIASQTNLLALNASIEAARVGEQGRGFAVVASEVRSLADQSTQSSKQVGHLITLIQAETNRAVHAMEQAKQEVAQSLTHVSAASEKFDFIQVSTNEVAQQIREVSDTVDTISASMDEVKQSVDSSQQVARETAGGTQTVSASTEEQLAQMQEITASSAALSRMAEELQNLIGRFKT